MIGCIEPLNAGFALSDPNDPRHAYITGLRRKYGEFLHQASVSLQRQGEENTVDAVHALVSEVHVTTGRAMFNSLRFGLFEHISWTMEIAETSGCRLLHRISVKSRLTCVKLLHPVRPLSGRDQYRTTLCRAESLAQSTLRQTS